MDVKLENLIEKIKTREVIDDSKTLKHYYGTVWLRYKWDNGTVRYKIEGRWKDVKIPHHNEDKIKKDINELADIDKEKKKQRVRKKRKKEES